MGRNQKKEWHDLAIQMSLDGFNATQIAEKFGVNRDTVRQYIKAYRKRNGISRDCKGNVVDFKGESSVDNTRVDYNDKTLTYTYEMRIKIPKGKKITVAKVLEINDLSADEWDITKFTINNWQGYSKDDNAELEKVDLYQVKLSVKPKVKSEITFEDIDAYMDNKVFTHKCPYVSKGLYLTEGHILQIDSADVHCGLLSWNAETNNDYDLKICKSRLLESVHDNVERAKREDIKKIYFCSLGDLLHIDNDKNTTAKGTLLQADGRLPKIFDFACDTMEEAINMLLSVGCDVEFVNTCGNHDRTTNYFLVKLLSAMYKNDERIKFDITPNPMKAIHFGKVLIGLAHGDMNKQNRGAWIFTDYREYISDSLFIEEHSGHIHSEQVNAIKSGVMCRSVLSTTGASYFDHQQGYRSQKGMQSFLWDEDKGLRSVWYYNL